MTSFGQKVAAAAGVADAATSMQRIVEQERFTLAQVTARGADPTDRLLALLLNEQRRTNMLLDALLRQPWPRQ